MTPLLAAWAATPAFFFWGVGLASIPIIIHILNRRRYKVVRWAAMEYLLAALRKNRRRLKFEQLLLLVTRCLLLALLGLALARPQGCSNRTIAALSGKQSALHIFIIDNSYPMSYQAARPETGDHLAQAKLMAKQQIQKLVDGSDSVAIILASRQPPLPPPAEQKDQARKQEAAKRADCVFLHPANDRKTAIAALDKVEQSFDAPDMAAALEAAERLALDEQNQPQKFLYIYTQFTSGVWETRDAESIRQTAKKIEQLLDKGHIRIHNLGIPGQSNFAVLDVRPEGKIIRAKLDTDLLAEVRGFGGGERTSLKWEWDRVVTGPDEIKVDANTPPQRMRKADLTSGGIHVVTASISDGHLPADNVRYRVLEVASELKVLVVEGNREGGAASLSLALAPKTHKESDGTIRSDSYLLPKPIGELDLSTESRRLGGYRAIILSDIGASVSDEQLNEIAQFAAQGGTLMMFLGENATDSYCKRLAERRLLPGNRLGARAAEQGSAFSFNFRPNSNVHPLLAIFKGEEQTGLNTVNIEKYIQLGLDPETRADVVLRYMDKGQETNDPAITVHSLGTGRIITFTTTGTSAWNTLPLKPCYVELLHELVAGTIDIGDRWMNVTVDECLEVPAALDVIGLPELKDDKDNKYAVEAVKQGDAIAYFRSQPMLRPGLYRLEYTSHRGPEVLPIAVNVPPDAANISLLPPKAIVSALGDVELEMLDDKLPETSLARQEKSDLGWFLMITVMLLVGAECWMAMHFGHYRRKSSSEQAAAAASPAEPAAAIAAPVTPAPAVAK